MTLYSIHCGFYDEEISEGIYEFHVNILVVAETLESAKAKVRTHSSFQKKKMHIDGIQEIQSVDGYKIQMIESLSNPTGIHNHLHRDL